MRVLFAGTPEFAAQALQALLAAGCLVPLVLTQADRPAGRGMKMQASPVKQVALEHGLPVAQPRGLRLDGCWAQDAAAAREAVLAAGAQVMVVAAYGLILPTWVLQAPPMGCLNIHASLLPRWRGAAPVHRAVEAGDERSGVTIMQMDEGLDTGPMLLVEDLPLAPRETTASLYLRLAELGARLIVEALERAACGGLRSVPQPDLGVTYAHKVSRAEAPLDWTQPADVLERRIRAFDPFPGATCRMGNEVIKVWEAEVAQARALHSPPGSVLAVRSTGVEVACGVGVLRLQQMQRPGGRRRPAALLATSLSMVPGDQLA